jgi:omega-6 fatty acid desaturase (delta-12 desaturase)
MNLDTPPALQSEPPSNRQWKKLIESYERPSRLRATWQLVNTLGSYVALWGLIYLCLSWSFWLALPVAVLAGGILVRLFIIFHDCGHKSFFQSEAANRFWGSVCGILTFTPFRHWTWEHSVHHATSGNLDKRGCGDIWTLTVTEYLESSRWKRISYRLARNPLILFVIAPLFLFLVRERFPKAGAKAEQRRSVYLTNLGILGIAVGMSFLFGVGTYLILQLIIMAIAGSAGVWLFYVQHQFEDAYWERREDWNYTQAALDGSSFYKLPKVFQWFSGNIGFHHIHHLSPRIPNYNLERCHKSHDVFRNVKPLTVWTSLKSLGFRLWDESERRLVGFRGLSRFSS